MKYIEQTALLRHRGQSNSRLRPIIISHFIDGKSQHPFEQSLEGVARTFLWKLLRQDQRFFNFVLPRFLEMKRHRPTLEWMPSVLRDLLELAQPEHTERWRWEKPHADLDFLISIDFAPGHSVSFHARQMLNSRLGEIVCIADSVIEVRDDKKKTIGELSGWVERFLDHSSGVQAFKSSTHLCRCWESDFSKMPVHKVLVQVRPALLNQMKVVLWHYIQLEVIKQTANISRLSQDVIEKAELQFASPTHYAAFNGLDYIVEELHRFGANLNYVAPESRYGTPLMAAIFGLSERRYTSHRMGAIKTLIRLDTTRRALNTTANEGPLGTATPIHAAIQLYTAYRKRTGLESEDLLQIIRFFLDQGAQVDPAVRAMAQSSTGELRKYFSDAPCRTALSSWATQFASTPPIPIQSPRQSRDSRNVTIGALGPMGVTRVASAARRGRMVQTVDERE